MISKTTRWARRACALIERLPIVADPRRFARYEISRLRATLPHRLRDSDLTVYLRHKTSDLDMLNKVFLDEAYRLPGPVLATFTGLERPLRVLDLGAHTGMFGLYVLERFPRTRIMALEPDPLNAVLLRRCVRANRRLDSWQVIDGAVSNRAGRTRFNFVRGAEPSRGMEGWQQEIAVDVIDAFELFPGHDLVKLDVKGEEWSILGDDRFPATEIPVLVVEYDGSRCAESDPRQYVHERLMNAGFSAFHSSIRPPGTGLLWAWRT